MQFPEGLENTPFNSNLNKIWPHCPMQFNSDKCFGRAFGRCRSTVQWSWRFRERNSIVHLYKVNRWLSGYCKVEYIKNLNLRIQK